LTHPDYLFQANTHGVLTSLAESRKENQENFIQINNLLEWLMDGFSDKIHASAVTNRKSLKLMEGKNHILSD
jgi:hypothetical protein